MIFSFTAIPSHHHHRISRSSSSSSSSSYLSAFGSSSSSSANTRFEQEYFDEANQNQNNQNQNDNDNYKYSFDAMKKFDDRLSLLEEASPDFLNDYYESDIRSFSISPGSSSGSSSSSDPSTSSSESGTSTSTNRKKKLSVSSTVYGLRALAVYPSSSLTRRILGNIGTPQATNQATATTTDKTKLRDQFRALIHSDWREDDLYDISLLLAVILRLDPTLVVVQSLLKEDENKEKGMTKTTKQQFRTMLQRLLSGRPLRRRGEDQQFSAHINYLCTTVYVDLATAINLNGNTNNDGSSNSNLRLGVINIEKELFDINNDDSDNDNDDTNDHKKYTEFFYQEITTAVSRSAEVSRDELCRQLAYKYSGDTGNFDVIKLVYNLLSYVKATESLKGVTTTIMITPPSLTTPPTTTTIDNTNNPDTTTENIPRMNHRLVSSALQVFFDEQDHNGQADGLWDRGQPIYKSMIKKGRDVGNAYVFGIDALGSLLHVLALGGGGTTGDAEVFRPYLPNLERALAWIERNVDIDTTVVNIAESALECNVETGRCYGRALRGWCSPHIGPGSGPNAWSTAQTITCVARMRRIVKQLLHNDVLTEFGGISNTNKNSNIGGDGGATVTGWDRLLDSDLGSNTDDDDSTTGCRTIKSVLEERVITPFIDTSDVSNPGVGASYSTILFGSPGTAKTTITEAVAEKLGWDFLVIDTSCFLADGLTNVASRIQYVFKRLQSLSRCVILFDEIEEFCLDRENPNLSMESRMLTTAMLTAINDLRRSKQSIFFLATNRLRAFDVAIIRPGRFDMQLFVGTPNLESRVILLKQALLSSSSSSTSSSSSSSSLTNENEKILKIYKNFLQSVWTTEQDAMFMNYLESKQYSSRVASIVESSRSGATSTSDDDDDVVVDIDIESLLNDDELSRILSQQAAVMTARGSVRDEYIAQMELSRL